MFFSRLIILTSEKKRIPRFPKVSLFQSPAHLQFLGHTSPGSITSEVGVKFSRGQDEGSPQLLNFQSLTKIQNGLKHFKVRRNFPLEFFTAMKVPRVIEIFDRWNRPARRGALNSPILSTPRPNAELLILFHRVSYDQQSCGKGKTGKSVLPYLSRVERTGVWKRNFIPRSFIQGVPYEANRAIFSQTIRRGEKCFK